MGYLDTLFLQRGGLKRFLKGYFANRKLMPVLTETFQDDLELFFNQDLDDLFNPYIYGRSNSEVEDDSKEIIENPYHPNLTENDLMSLL